jgi:hypothetical protein
VLSKRLDRLEQVHFCWRVPQQGQVRAQKGMTSSRVTDSWQAAEEAVKEACPEGKAAEEAGRVNLTATPAWLGRKAGRHQRLGWRE